MGIEGPHGEPRYLHPGRDLMWQCEPCRAPSGESVPDQILTGASEDESRCWVNNPGGLRSVTHGAMRMAIHSNQTENAQPLRHEESINVTTRLEMHQCRRRTPSGIAQVQECISIAHVHCRCGTRAVLAWAPWCGQISHCFAPRTCRTSKSGGGCWSKDSSTG